MKQFKKSVALMLLTMPMLAFADGQVKTKVISSDYSRNSISNVVVTYGDRWDNEVVMGINAINTGAKFDLNEIQTKTVRLTGAYRTAEEQQKAAAANTEQKSSSFKEMFSGIGDSFKSMGNGIAAKPDTLTQRLLTEYINNNNIGKQIFDYVLAVDKQGCFHYDIMVERSRWNATDEDVHLDNASQVKQMDENGPALLANSYIIVYDAKETKIGEATKKDGTKVPVYMANVSAYVFAIDSAENVIGNILGNMWINNDEPAETKAAKRSLYANVHIPMKCVAAVSASASSEKSMTDAITGSYNEILRKAENKISAWEVSATLEDVKPYITAKIGTKEGIKNAQRFKIYGNKGDADEGTLRTVKKGYARATVINDNDTIADGETGVSYFYQISGAKLKGTEFIKQSNDIKLGVSIDYNYNGLGWPNQKVFGAFSMVDVTFDYLAYMHKNGISHYARINVGYDIKTKSMLAQGMAKQLGIEKEEAEEALGYEVINYNHGEASYNSGFYHLDKGVSFVNVSVGYMCGLKLKQVIEFQPMLNIGADMPVYHGSVNLTKEQKKTNYGVFIDPGIRFVFNCGYPFQIFVQGDYSVMVMQGDTYKDLNSTLKFCGNERKMGLGLAAGVKWTF